MTISEFPVSQYGRRNRQHGSEIVWKSLRERNEGQTKGNTRGHGEGQIHGHFNEVKLVKVDSTLKGKPGAYRKVSHNFKYSSLSTKMKKERQPVSSVG